MTEPSEPQEVELADDLLEYAKRSAIKEARKHCPKYVHVEDVAHEAVLTLMCKPPKYDPPTYRNELARC